MITPVAQEAASPPQPVIPAPEPRDKSKVPTVAVVLVAAVIFVPVLLLTLGVFFLRAGSPELVVSEPNAVEQFDLGREADMAMDVSIVLESGPTVVLPEVLHPGEDRDVVEGTVQFVSTVTSDSGRTDVYRYQAVLLDGGETMDCLGLAAESGASVICGDTPNAPLVMWGTEERNVGTWYSVGVAGLPQESTVLITETEAGRSVSSAVVNGVAYQEWPAVEGSTGGLVPNGGREFGVSVRTYAVDVDGLIVWSEAGNN